MWCMWSDLSKVPCSHFKQLKIKHGGKLSELICRSHIHQQAFIVGVAKNCKSFTAFWVISSFFNIKSHFFLFQFLKHRKILLTSTLNQNYLQLDTTGGKGGKICTLVIWVQCPFKKKFWSRDRHSCRHQGDVTRALTWKKGLDKINWTRMLMFECKMWIIFKLRVTLLNVCSHMNAVTSSWSVPGVKHGPVLEVSVMMHQQHVSVLGLAVTEERSVHDFHLHLGLGQLPAAGRLQQQQQGGAEPAQHRQQHAAPTPCSGNSTELKSWTKCRRGSSCSLYVALSSCMLLQEVALWLVASLPKPRPLTLPVSASAAQDCEAV